MGTILAMAAGSTVLDLVPLVGGAKTNMADPLCLSLVGKGMAQCGSTY